MILAFYALTSGHIARADEIHKAASAHGRDTIVVQRLAQTAKGGASGSGAASSSTSADPLQKAAGGARSTRQKYDSTLRHALQLAADLDLRDKSRMIGVVALPITTWHGHCMKEMRSVEAVKNAYIEWAQWKFTKTAREMLNTLVNSVALEESGFVMSFPKQAYNEMTVASPEVVSQESLAKEMEMFVRALSSMHHCIAYPGRLAGLLHKSSSVRAHFEKSLHEHLSDIEALQARPEAAAARIAKRSCMHLPIMKICRDMLRRHGDEFPEVLREYIPKVFECWGQTKINEGANRAVRQSEARGQHNKVTHRVRRWAAPRQEAMITQRGRTEVEPTTDMPCPTNLPGDFFRVGQAQMNDQKLPLSKILTKTPTWPTIGYESVHNLFTDIVLSRYMVARNGWQRIDDLWQVNLTPPRAKSSASARLARTTSYCMCRRTRPAYCGSSTWTDASWSSRTSRCCSGGS